MSKRRLATAALLLTLLISGVVLVALAFVDNHRWNIRYVGWKRGMLPWNEELVVRYLGVDSELRLSLRGKTREEVRRLFPDLREPTQANLSQAPYVERTHGMDLLWIGDSQWCIEFENDRLTAFHLFKG